MAEPDLVIGFSARATRVHYSREDDVIICPLGMLQPLDVDAIREAVAQRWRLS